VITGKKLTHSWRYEDMPGYHMSHGSFFDKDDQTLLKLTHAGIDTFPNANPDFDISNFVVGWDHIINKSLKNILGRLARS